MDESVHKIINKVNPSIEQFIELGFIPREYSKLISVEIDINQTQYEIIVLEVKDNGNYNDIFVEMRKV